MLLNPGDNIQRCLFLELFVSILFDGHKIEVLESGIHERGNPVKGSNACPKLRIQQLYEITLN